MTTGQKSMGLELTEEEAFALLELCMTSSATLDATSEQAMKKLAKFCRRHLHRASHHIGPTNCEFCEAG